jgi:hypothetical protein
MTDSYEIRDVYDSDYEAIADLADKNELLLEGLTTTIFSRMLKWLHGNSGTCRRVQILAQSHDGVLAHYGGVPFKMKWFEKSISAVLASNLVIDKNFRKQSPFFALQKEFIKSYQEKGYSFAYGVITREGVLNPHLRMGWKSLGALHVYARPISLNLIFKKLEVNYLIYGLAKYPLKLIQKIWDVIFFLNQKNVKVFEEINFNHSLSAQLGYWMSKKLICSKRSIDTLNWRFCEFEDRNYRIFIANINSISAGYMVVRLMQMKGFLSVAIIDIVVFNDDKNVFKALVNKSILYARQSNAELVVSAITDHDGLKNSFQRSGFVKTREQFTIVGHFPKNGRLKFSEFNFSDFHINWFDHDYV